MDDETTKPTEERIVIDMRRSKDAPAKELTADLIMEIDLVEDGYQASYHSKREEGGHELVFRRTGLDRVALVNAHVEAIQQVKPKTALVRTGRHSSGHQRDILLNPGVVKMIIEGKLTAAQLLPG